MNSNRSLGERAAGGSLAHMIASALVAAALGLCLGYFFAASPAIDAFAPASTSQAPSAQVVQVATGGSAQADTNAAASAQDGAVSIEDDATPMSSGLGGGEPVSSGFGIGGLVLAGIAAIAVLFAVFMRRLNGNIDEMKGVFK